MRLKQGPMASHSRDTLDPPPLNWWMTDDGDGRSRIARLNRKVAVGWDHPLRFHAVCPFFPIATRLPYLALLPAALEKYLISQPPHLTNCT